ncbi:MAG: hypothetical protein V1881_02455 [Candidatus Micrarchaeota archaeon]
MFKKSRAQVFAVDLIVSAAVFFSVFILASSMLSELQRDAAGSSARASLADSSSGAADALLLSPGSPADWNNATVTSLGLADEPFALNLTKLLRLKDVRPDDLSWLMGAGRLNASINITSNGETVRSGFLRERVAYFSNGDVDLPQYLQGMDWDYYWAGIGTPDWRDSLSQHGGATLDEILENRSAYNSIIVEDAGLSYADVDISSLQDFLEQGGLLLCEGRCASLLGSNFSVSTEAYPAGRAGIVADPSFVLYNVSIGDAVAFTWAREAFYSNESEGDADLRIVVRDSVNLSSALIGSWRYGNGVIHYISDAEAEFGGLPASEALNIAGFPLAFGNPPSNQMNVFMARRPCLVEADFRQPALLELAVWDSG